MLRTLSRLAASAQSANGAACSLRAYATEAAVTAKSDLDESLGGGERKLKRIGRALATYLKQSNEHGAMLDKERADFELGRRHLANMMSLDPNALTQADIDRAIEYLFPSGLTDPKARPVMRPPDEILPKFHRFTFDDEGRPHGSRFYTLAPKFYGLLSDIGMKTAQVNRFYHEHAVLKHKNAADLMAIDLTGTQWIPFEKLKKRLGEKFSEEMYVQLLLAFDYLCSLPGSTVEKNFIMDYRETLAATTDSKLFGPRVPEVDINAQLNRRCATVKTHCKATKAEVTVYDAGTGKFDIDGIPLDKFQLLQTREILLAPLLVAELLGRVDVVARTSGDIGSSSQPRAVRHGTALGIAALFPQMSERLRLSGLLTLDPRKRERSKVNQPGARAKWIWKRR